MLARCLGPAIPQRRPIRGSPTTWADKSAERKVGRDAPNEADEKSRHQERRQPAGELFIPRSDEEIDHEGTASAGERDDAATPPVPLELVVFRRGLSVFIRNRVVQENAPQHDDV